VRDSSIKHGTRQFLPLTLENVPIAPADASNQVGQAKPICWRCLSRGFNGREASLENRGHAQRKSGTLKLLYPVAKKGSWSSENRDTGGVYLTPII
jgi:hypothetical protein